MLDLTDREFDILDKALTELVLNVSLSIDDLEENEEPDTTSPETSQQYQLLDDVLVLQAKMFMMKKGNHGNS